MTRRALLVWETGAGRTHAEHLKQVGLGLKVAGWDCLVLHFNTRFAAEFAALGLASAQAPVWPPRLGTETPWPSRDAHCMVDTVANMGMADPAVLAGILAHYETVFALFKPDLVIGEWGYGAGLAARGRLPFIALGSSASIAPLTATRAAPYDPARPDPVWHDDAVVAAVNAGLARAGRPAIDRPRDLIAADRRFCLALPECDIYAGRRDEPNLAPLVGPLPPAPATRGEELLIYLHGFSQYNDALMAGLITAGRPATAYVPGLGDDGAALLAGYGVSVRARPFSLDEIARRAGVMLHHGGGQLTAQLLALGVPQILLMKEATNRAAGDSVARLGVGRAIRQGDVTVGWLADAIGDSFAAPIRDRAQELAPHYRAALAVDPLPILLAACHALTGAA